MEAIPSKVTAALSYIRSKSGFYPDIALILGSRFDCFTDSMDKKYVFNMEDIPHFPEATVRGHAGLLIMGYLGDKKIVVMQGRYHYYEGYSMHRITFPIRVMKALGVNTLFISGAAATLTPSLSSGDIMIIKDHINLMGDNPLIGNHDISFGDRFPDMTHVYDQEIRFKMQKIATENKIQLSEGVYLAARGPSYLTEVERLFYRKIGADVIGMSTVPEAIVAKQASMKIMAISTILGSVKRDIIIEDESKLKQAEEKVSLMITRLLMDI